VKSTDLNIIKVVLGCVTGIGHQINENWKHICRDFKGQVPKSMKGARNNKTKTQVPRQGEVRLPSGHDQPILRQHKRKEALKK
jgi:hypothetical protein